MHICISLSNRNLLHIFFLVVLLFTHTHTHIETPYTSIFVLLQKMRQKRKRYHNDCCDAPPSLPDDVWIELILTKLHSKDIIAFSGTSRRNNKMAKKVQLPFKPTPFPHRSNNIYLTFNDTYFSNTIDILETWQRNHGNMDTDKNGGIEFKCVFNEKRTDFIPDWVSKVFEVEVYSYDFALFDAAIMNRYFRGVPIVTISCCTVQNLNVFSNAKQVNLYDVNIDDISPLVSVEYVSLMDCPNISDVSCLRNVKKLYLSDVKKVKEVHSLNKLHHLFIDNMQHAHVRIYDLDNISILSLNRTCYVREEVLQLKKLKRLKLRGCLEEMYLSDFVCLEFVGVYHCQMLRNDYYDVSQVGNAVAALNSENDMLQKYWTSSFQQKAVVIGCDALDNVSSLSRFRSVKLGNLKKLRSVECLANVQFLTVFDCDCIEDLHTVSDFQKIHLRRWERRPRSSFRRV